MPSDEWISPVLNYSKGGYSYSSNATNASTLLYSTIHSNLSVAYNNNTSLGPTMKHSLSMPVWSQLILYTLLLMFVCFAFRTPSPDARFRAGLQRRERQARLAELRSDPAVRERAMEKGLITKRIVSCDDKSTLILGDLDGSVSDDVHSIHSTDPNTSSCSICLEAFQISDTVTWSRADVCRHVFHTDCIHEWFSNPKHEDCPSCRAQIIDLDQPDETSDRDNNDTGLLYMVMDGLVSTVASRAPWITGEGEPSRLQIAFRRVSSGIYSHLSQTFDFDLDEDEDSVDGAERFKKLERPVKLRRTLSEGIRSDVRSRDSSLGKYALSKSICATSAAPEEESQKDDPLQIRPALRRTLSDGPSPDRRKNDEASRPGLFVTQAFRRSSSRVYAKITGTFEEDDDEEDELGFMDNSWGKDDDDDSLRLQSPTVLFSDEEDVELGQSR